MNFTDRWLIANVAGYEGTGHRWSVNMINKFQNIETIFVTATTKTEARKIAKAYGHRIMRAVVLNLEMIADEPETICPRCRTSYTGYPALSRMDNQTEICSECGTEEAIADFLGEPHFTGWMETK
jgi:RNase P subunit RPR2